MFLKRLCCAFFSCVCLDLCCCVCTSFDDIYCGFHCDCLKHFPVLTCHRLCFFFKQKNKHNIKNDQLKRQKHTIVSIFSASVLPESCWLQRNNIIKSDHNCRHNCSYGQIHRVVCFCRIMWVPVCCSDPCCVQPLTQYLLLCPNMETKALGSSRELLLNSHCAAGQEDNLWELLLNDPIFSLHIFKIFSIPAVIW